MQRISTDNSGELARSLESWRTAFMPTLILNLLINSLTCNSKILKFLTERNQLDFSPYLFLMHHSLG